ncbi:MAG: folate-binding protein [Steroidobacteraceae bacterium]
MANSLLKRLDFLEPIRVSGTDARVFLQGQLSNDIARLDAGHCQLASLNSAQGRVQAVITLVPAGDGLIMLVPTSMATGVLQRLRKYVLRSKVTFIEPQPDFVLRAASEPALAAAGLANPGQPGHCVQQGTITVVRWYDANPDAPARFLLLGPAADLPAPDPDPADADWRLADIRAGLPHVLPETHESFVAQMLNLDAVGGISFTKGCYTGQEIIARTHYRGAIKRRMLRFAAACPPPPPGTRVLEGDASAGEVVDAAATPEGCELLAVISLAQKEAALHLAGPFAAILQSVPLPYSITEPA